MPEQDVEFVYIDEGEREREKSGNNKVCQKFAINLFACNSIRSG
jgi:hypothetical protein